ncbi:glycosyl hydrolases family 18-domain-containing protein [Mycena latifolia]|nr:glycosyl hydrolases family 18-domain-containing protein [Mycena latifolia]
MVSSSCATLDSCSSSTVNFAFAYISDSFEVVEMTPGDSKLWTETTALKSQNPALKVFLSIGGWTFNNPPTAGIFSALAASSANTNKFIKSVLNVMNAYGFDGIDIDWEYPVAEDRGGSAHDKANYPTFLKAVKKAFTPYGYELSFTAPSSYWYLQNYDLPNLLADGAADWVNVMTYDLHGVWDSPADYIGSIVLGGANIARFQMTFQLYANVGIDPSKIVMGIGFYGRSFELSSASCTDPGCPFAGAAPAGPCSANAGTLMFAEIEDIISSVGSDQLVFDEAAAVKYLVYDTNSWVSYDDQQTLDMKLQYANGICLNNIGLTNCKWYGTLPNCLDSACPVGQTVIFSDYQGDASSPCLGNNQRNYCCDTPNGSAKFSPVDVDDVFPESETIGDAVTFAVDYDDNQGTTTDTVTGDGSSGLSDDGRENDSPFSSIFISSPNAASVSSLDLDSDWALTDCDATSDEAQLVLAYCTCPMAEEDCGCAHVFIGGAADTIVKLPSSCGLGPYARVVSLEVHPDQTVLSGKHARKRSADPVYSLAFDYASVSRLRTFAFLTASTGLPTSVMRADMTDMPGYWDSIIDSPPDATSSVRKRDLNFHQPRGVEKRWFGSFKAWLAKLNTLTTSDSISRNYHWSDTYTIFHQEESCPNFQSSLDISTCLVIMFASINSQFGYYLEATIVPPAVQQAYVYFKAGMSFHKAAFTITGIASASWNSGRYELVNFGFPGLYYPGLLTLGPSLHLYGELSGQLSLSGTYKTSVSYTFPNLDLSFGKQDADAGVSNFGTPVAPTNHFRGFNSSVGWNVELSGTADVHLIPSLQLGVSVLGGTLIDAQVFVEADLFAGLSITGSVSKAVALDVCITPDIGVSLNAGLTGSVLYWQTGPLSTTFYTATSTLEPSCLNSVTEPAGGSGGTSRKRLISESVVDISGSGSTGWNRSFERRKASEPAHAVVRRDDHAEGGHWLSKRGTVSTIKSCTDFTSTFFLPVPMACADGSPLLVPIAVFDSLKINAYYDLASPAILDGGIQGYANMPPYYSLKTSVLLSSITSLLSRFLHCADSFMAILASLFIDYLHQFPEVWTDGSGDDFCKWVDHNLCESNRALCELHSVNLTVQVGSPCIHARRVEACDHANRLMLSLSRQL